MAGRDPPREGPSAKYIQPLRLPAPGELTTCKVHDDHLVMKHVFVVEICSSFLLCHGRDMPSSYVSRGSHPDKDCVLLSILLHMLLRAWRHTRMRDASTRSPKIQGSASWRALQGGCRRCSRWRRICGCRHCRQCPTPVSANQPTVKMEPCHKFRPDPSKKPLLVQCPVRRPVKWPINPLQGFYPPVHLGMQ